MAPRSVEAIEAAVVATGLLEVGGPCGHAPDGDARRVGPVLVMCSAGRDSLCLLDLAVRRRGVNGVRVLHVDHGLRAESASEADFVRTAGAALGVDVIVRRADPPPTTGNLHAWARAVRSTFAAREAVRIRAVAIATAHTRSDLIETALFRLATQPGRRALLAMRALEHGPCGHAGDGRIPPLVRPLLGVGREETLAYCLARGLLWRDDPSNADRRFARARLRHSVTPVLRSLNPQFEDSIVRTLQELEQEREALDAIVADALPSDASSIAVPALTALPRPVARLVLRELCERAIGRPCPRAAARLDELIARALRDPSPFELDVGEGARLSVRRAAVTCVASTGPAAPTSRG